MEDGQSIVNGANAQQLVVVEPRRDTDHVPTLPQCTVEQNAREHRQKAKNATQKSVLVKNSNHFLKVALQLI